MLAVDRAQEPTGLVDAESRRWDILVSLTVERCLLIAGPREFRNECALPPLLDYARGLLGETS
jgi:hypothetical protein